MEVIAIVLVICGAIFVATICCCCFNLCKYPLQVYSLDYKCRTLPYSIHTIYLEIKTFGLGSRLI